VDVRHDAELHGDSISDRPEVVTAALEAEDRQADR
jgi:hypothetical protein